MVAIWELSHTGEIKTGAMIIRLTLGKIIPVSKEDRLLRGWYWRQRDQLGSYCNCGGGKGG